MKIALVCPYDFAYPGGVAKHIYSLECCLTEMGSEFTQREAASLVPTIIREVLNRVPLQRSRI